MRGEAHHILPHLLVDEGADIEDGLGMRSLTSVTVMKDSFVLADVTMSTE